MILSAKGTDFILKNDAAMRRLKAKKRQELLPAGYFILLLPYLKQIEIILLIQIFYIKTHLLLIRFEGIIHFSGNMFFGAG